MRGSFARVAVGASLLLISNVGLAQEEDEEATEAAAREDDTESQGLGGQGYLGIDTQLFSTGTAKISVASATPPGTVTTVDYKTTQVGLASPSWGLAFGYAPGDYVSLGARLMFESATVSVGNTETTATGVGFAPNLRVLMSANQSAVPYANMTIGYKKLTTEVNGTSSGAGVDGVMYGGGFGALIFPNPNVSFEPSLAVLWNTIKSGSSSETVTSFGVYFGFSISAWFGGKPVAAPHSEQDSEPVSRSFATPKTIEPSTGKLNVYLRNPDQELHVSINPNDETPQFNLTLLMPAGDTAGCDVLHLKGAEEEVSLSADLDHSLDKRRQIITTTVPYRALERGVGEGIAHVTACDKVWKLNAVERQKLSKLLKIFRARARELGTFDAAAAVPLPSVAESQEPSESAPNDQ